MTIMKIASLVLVILGILSIVFSKQLGALYEGVQYTMSDLGFITGGIMLIGIGALLLIITLVLHLAKR